MIDGAAGYTGRTVAEHAASDGLALVLAGREQDPAALEAVAAPLGAEVRLFSLDDALRIRGCLEGIAVLLNGRGTC